MEKFWLDSPTLLPLVKNQWHSDQPINVVILNFIHKVKIWNKNTFPNIFKEKRRILARLEGVQKSIQNNHSGQLASLETSIQDQFHNLLVLERDFWLMKSGINKLLWMTLMSNFCKPPPSIGGGKARFSPLKTL